MQPKILFIGFGNPGRLDDGLGPAFVEALEGCGLSRVQVDSNYQLALEDAELVAQFSQVVFVDAGTGCAEPFEMRRVEAVEMGPGFSSHALSPEAVLGLAKSTFGREPKAWMLTIRGYEFNEFGEGLSQKAEGNLQRSLEFIRRTLTESPDPVLEFSQRVGG